MSNKTTILIIGGTSGIGLATAVRFSKDHDVIVTGRDKAKGEMAQLVPGITFVQSDISVESNRKKLLKTITDKNVSKVIHCAGIFNDCEDKDYQEKYEAIKFGGVILINQLLTIKKITHVCATSSLYTFLPDAITPKFEKLIQMKLEAAILTLSENVIANCVAPGLTNTPLVQKVYGESGIKKLLSLAPGSRIVEPEEIAETLYWLSNQNVINDSVIPVDGGFLRNYQVVNS